MESGIFVVGFYHARRRKSLTTAQEYIGDSTVEKTDRADRRIKLGNITDESQGHTILQGNQYVINITSDGSSGHYSLFSGIIFSKLLFNSEPAPQVIGDAPLPQIENGSV